MKLLKLVTCLILVLTFHPANADVRTRVRSEIEGLSVKVKTCEANDNGDVIITFTIENQRTSWSPEYTLLWHHNIKVFDDEGNKYNGSTDPSKSLIKLANASDTFSNKCTVYFEKEVPLKYKIKVIDVDPRARLLNVDINLSCGWDGWNGHIKFFNVPITRDGDE